MGETTRKLALTVEIKVEHLTRTFRSKDSENSQIVANDDLSFEVYQGEIFGLLGANGAGKTTLIHQLLGLLQPSSGNIWVEGIDVVRYPNKVKKLTGFLPQTGVGLQELEVERALHYTGRLRGQSDRDARLQARQLIEELELTPYANRYVNKLSGGMLRMTNFAMALMGHPHVLVLDEPTNELDPNNRRIVWDKIARLNREQGVTCMLVTHNVLEAEHVIQRVAVMEAGRFIALGTPGELKKRYSKKVRFEFRLKDDELLGQDEYLRLSDAGELKELRPAHYQLALPAEMVANAAEKVLSIIGLHRLDDFRLAPVSLEDIYIQLKEIERTSVKIRRSELQQQ